MDVVTIAQLASAIGTVGLTVLFGFQLRVFYRQVLVNHDTLQEMRESRTAHERPALRPAHAAAERTRWRSPRPAGQFR